MEVTYCITVKCDISGLDVDADECVRRALKRARLENIEDYVAGYTITDVEIVS